MSVKASAYIITLNEAHNIRRALESVRDFDEIIVVDSGSTDGTPDIARAYTDRVHHQDWLGYSGQKAYALSLCSNEWALNIDADEEVTPELKQDIRALVEDGGADALDIPFEDRFFGLPAHPGSGRNSKPRFFRKDKVRYGDHLVHEGVTVAGKIRKAKGAIVHWGGMTIKSRVEKANAYSSLKAKEKFQGGGRASLFKLLLAFPYAFVRTYFFKRDLLNGRRAIINCMIVAFYAFLKEAKLYELHVEEQLRQSGQASPARRAGAGDRASV